MENVSTRQRQQSRGAHAPVARLCCRRRRGRGRALSGRCQQQLRRQQRCRHCMPERHSRWESPPPVGVRSEQCEGEPDRVHTGTGDGGEHTSGPAPWRRWGMALSGGGRITPRGAARGAAEATGRPDQATHLATPGGAGTMLSAPVVVPGAERWVGVRRRAGEEGSASERGRGGREAKARRRHSSETEARSALNLARGWGGGYGRKVAFSAAGGG